MNSFENAIAALNDLDASRAADIAADDGVLRAQQALISAQGVKAGAVRRLNDAQAAVTAAIDDVRTAETDIASTWGIFTHPPVIPDPISDPVIIEPVPISDTSV